MPPHVDRPCHLLHHLVNGRARPNPDMAEGGLSVANNPKSRGPRARCVMNRFRLASCGCNWRAKKPPVHTTGTSIAWWRNGRPGIPWSIF
eukprot:11085493-Prorocentrum_lima.AAC.1